MIYLILMIYLIFFLIAGVMAQIKPLIDVLRAASDISASSFLCLLYKTHPPSYKVQSDTYIYTLDDAMVFFEYFVSIYFKSGEHAAI